MTRIFYKAWVQKVQNPTFDPRRRTVRVKNVVDGPVLYARESEDPAALAQSAPSIY